MKPNFQCGEFGVSLGDDDYLFRPSFRNIRSIGTPKEIIDMLVLLAGGRMLDNVPASLIRQHVKLTTKQLFNSAVDVLDACCSRDTSGLFGYYIGNKYHPGKMNINNVIQLGRLTIESGVIGKPKPRKGQKKESVREFNVTEFVMMAVSNLNMSMNDAENLTMVEFQCAMDIAFPEKDEDKIIGETEYNEGMNRAMALMPGAK